MQLTKVVRFGRCRTVALLTLLVVLLGVSIGSFAASAAAATPASLQPPTPHPVEGRQDCLACHAPSGGVKPAPANHSGYDNTTCLGCHQVTAQPSAQQSPTGACTDCHANRDLSLTFASGEPLSVFVDQGALGASVHGGRVGCTDCHRDITGFPHRSVPALTKRDYSIGQYTLCRNCHFNEYTKTLDSMHFQALTQVNPLAPLCTDCHDYHAVTRPNEPRTKVSTLCGRCHNQVYEQYLTSVHGSALTETANPDVPVCTDCHKTHSISDTHTAAFHLDVPLLCAQCHADRTIAARYNIKANVYETYMRDFHGATVLLYRAARPEGHVEVAVCNDCHGTHDIRPLDEGTVQETRQKALARCQQCHPDAGQNFPDAWLGHFEINPTDTPAVWLVRVFYWLLIPYMLVGLALFIVADLWRARRRRREGRR